MKTVGVIGGSGFIGSYITKVFLEHGFKVRVSSTDISNKEKYKHLHSLENSDHLEIAALNLEDKSTIKDFVSDCQIVIHGGTPFQLAINDPQSELLDPTIKGTENFLNLIKDSDVIEKVVFIASVASYNAAFPLPAPNRSSDHLYTENDDPFCNEECHPYAQAKYYADQVVKSFVSNHPNLNFEIVSVYPVFVVGRPLSARADSTSAGLQALFKDKIAPDPFVESIYANDVAFAMVDVQDVADSVYMAATTPGIHGNGYLLTSESWPVSDISLMLNGKDPNGKAQIVYSNELASRDLNIDFSPASKPLATFASK